MMLPIDFTLAKMRQQEFLRESEENRLIKLAKQANTKPKVATRVLFELGRRKAKLGIRMQALYGSEAAHFGSVPRRGAHVSTLARATRRV